MPYPSGHLRQWKGRACHLSPLSITHPFISPLLFIPNLLGSYVGGDMMAVFSLSHSLLPALSSFRLPAVAKDKDGKDGKGRDGWPLASSCTRESWKERGSQLTYNPSLRSSTNDLQKIQKERRYGKANEKRCPRD